MSVTNYIWAGDPSRVLHLPQDMRTLNRAACGALGELIRQSSSRLNAGSYDICTVCRTVLGR